MNEVLVSGEFSDEASVLQRAGVDVRVTATGIQRVVLRIDPNVVNLCHHETLRADWQLNRPRSLLNVSARCDGMAGDNAGRSNDEKLAMEGKRVDVFVALEDSNWVGNVVAGDVSNACGDLLDSV